MVTLAGNVGGGNVVGVATAILSGGMGAVFWMWVAAFFGMALKYGEIVLSRCTGAKMKWQSPQRAYVLHPRWP